MTRGEGGHAPAKVQKYLRDFDYPATKDDLLTQAGRNEARQEIIDTIRAHSGNRTRRPQDVMKGYGEIE